MRFPSLKNQHVSWVWRHSPHGTHQYFGRLRQEGHKFEASLRNLMRPCPEIKIKMDCRDNQTPGAVPSAGTEAGAGGVLANEEMSQECEED